MKATPQRVPNDENSWESFTKAKQKKTSKSLYVEAFLTTGKPEERKENSSHFSSDFLFLRQEFLSSFRGFRERV